VGGIAKRNIEKYFDFGKGFSEKIAKFVSR
jgi:hypothetical protein